MNRSSLPVVALLIFFPSLAHAFPEMIRHNYANCATCHVSPSGGGVLTAYGRQITKELLSTWGTDQETKVADLFEPPEWLNLGGDFRWVQTYKTTPAFEAGQLIRMQSDFEGAVNVGKFTFAQTMGWEATRSASGVQGGGGEFFSRRQYLMYHFDDELSLRFGKFLFNYGINTPDHIQSTKRGLGWDEGSETLNLEAAYVGETWTFFATGIFGRPDSPFLNREKGISLVAARMLTENKKLGLSYFHGWNNFGGGSSENRDVFGPFTILGFTKQLYLLAEVDAQRQNTTPASGPSTNAWGLVDYAKLGYEVHQGIHLYVSQEYTQTDFSQDTSKVEAYTAGVIWYPRPHLEFNLAWQVNRAPALSNEWSDLAWIMIHVYL